MGLRGPEGSNPYFGAMLARYEEAMLLDPSALGEIDRAVTLLASLFARAPEWRELLQRLEMPEAAPLKARLPR